MLRRFGLLLLPCLWVLGGAVGPARAAPEAPVHGVQAREAPVRAAADAAEREGPRPRSRWAERRARRAENEARFRNASLVRGGIALAGFAVFCAGAWTRRGGRPDRWRRLRLALLAALALASFASYYNFFRAGHPGGFKGADVFHYYMGSKYFGELGYFELYHCTLAALVEDGQQDPNAFPEVRDQRTLRLEPPSATAAGVRDCPERFSPDRWRSFKRDLAFFRPRILGGSWTHLLVDHGYNPTPVWSFAGGIFSKPIPADSPWFPWLIALDRGLVLAMGALIAWAFGLEALCLAAIAWGASPLWSYNWIGDAFLRNLWLFSAVLGLCLLERGRQLASGAALAFASLLRIFPGIFVAGFLAHAAVRARREGIPRDARRFVVGVAAGSLLLLAAGAFGTGRGPGAYLEFQQKMSAVVAQAGVNKIGLSALAAELVHRATTVEVRTPEGRTVKVETPAPFTVGAIRSLQALLVVLGLLAFWRALARISAVEATVLGFALIPLLTSPTNYYYPFVVGAAMLSRRRPWMGVALSLCVLAWIVSDQLFFLQDARYLAWDAVSVVFVSALLAGAAFTSQPSADAASPSAPATPTTA